MREEAKIKETEAGIAACRQGKKILKMLYSDAKMSRETVRQHISAVQFLNVGGGLHSTEDAFLLPTPQFRVRDFFSLLS